MVAGLKISTVDTMNQKFLGNSGMANLIDLHGQVFDQGGGYWIKIEAWQVNVSAHIPHGVRYSLTLHEPYGKRILGYDNAHAIEPIRSKKFATPVVAFDHKHRHSRDGGVRYEFHDAYQLLSDFFQEVDRMLKEIQTP